MISYVYPWYCCVFLNIDSRNQNYKLHYNNLVTLSVDSNLRETLHRVAVIMFWDDVLRLFPYPQLFSLGCFLRLDTCCKQKNPEPQT